MAGHEGTIERAIEIAQRYRRRFGLRVGDAVGYADQSDPFAYNIREIDQATGIIEMGYIDRQTGTDITKTALAHLLVDVNVVRRAALRIKDRQSNTDLARFTRSNPKKAHLN